MTYQTTVCGVKTSSNDLELIMKEVANILKGQDCKTCHGKGSYLVANGEDDQDWEYCQH